MEESKNQEDIHETFEVLSKQVLLNQYLQELWAAFSKNREVELVLKAKAQEA